MKLQASDAPLARGGSVCNKAGVEPVTPLHRRKRVPRLLAGADRSRQNWVEDIGVEPMTS